MFTTSMGKSKFWFVLLLCTAQITHAQLFKKEEEKTIVKTGPYIGVQSGRFYAGEVGVERQWKQGKLKSPNTHSLHFGVNYSYDFRDWNPILGYDIGYWYKGSNVGLTWGGALAMRTNFEQYRYGIVPTVGYKVWQIHLQTGVHLLYPFSRNSANYFTTNTLFLSARFVIVNDREVKRKSKKK
jgi:hypothetical protein